VLNNEQKEKPFGAGEQVTAQLTDPHALLAAMQHLRQEVTRESEELYRQWRPHVLTRMQDHQVKKTPQLRALHMWQ